MEKWKKMYSPYDNYDISDNGRLRNNKTNYYFNLNIRLDGYIRVCINKTNFMIHRLVCEYFLENYNSNLIVNHKDGNRSNNNIKNLEMLTILENNNSKIFENYGTKFREVTQYDINNNIIRVWHRIKDIPNISKKSIHDALKNNKLYKGYYWEYFNEKILDETWMTLNIFNSLIEISSIGRIKLKSGKITYGNKDMDGYYNTIIENHHVKVHRLVCMAFKPISNYNDLLVNHIDANRGNNNIYNLEWATPSENSIHTYKVNNPKRNIRRCKVIKIDNLIETEYESLEIAAKLNNIKTKGNITLVCQNKRKTAGGFIWKYK
jgi:hypothetical protein